MNEYVPALSALCVPLPEDIQRLKDFGDFDRMTRVMDMRLARDLPVPLRDRLLLEKRIIRRLVREYPYTMQDGERMMAERLSAWTTGELDKLRDEDAVDWIYVHGKPHLRANFFNNLMTTRADLAAREKDRTRDEHKKADTQLLDDVIARMKREQTLRARLRMRVSLTLHPEIERDGARICVHLPLPLRYAQTQAVRLLHFEPIFTHIAAEDYPQRTASYHGPHAAGQSYTAEYELDVCMRYTELDPARVSPAQPSFHTEEQLPHIRFTPYLRTLVNDIVGNEKNPLVQAKLVYDYITSHVTYSYMRSYLGLIDIAQYAATGMKGDCGVQAILFITLLRILNIPARWQAGLYATPHSVGNHDWAQFYVAPYGWLFADCSFGGSAYRAGNETRRDFYFGALDPFRIPLNSEFQHAFDPPMRHLRYDPYDNQDGEAEYDDEALDAADYETTQHLLQYTEL